MATNTLLDISKITNKALMVLENDLTFSSEANREYSDQFAVSGAKIGYTVNVRKPARYVGTSGPNLNVEGTTETYIPVTVGNPSGTNPYGDQFHVDVQFSTADRLLALDEFADRIIKPAVATVANRIDYIGLLMAKNSTYQNVGTPGTPSTAANTYLTAMAQLDSQAVPRDGKRSVFLDPFSNVAIMDSLKGLFNPAETIAEQYQKGMMGRGLGTNFKMDQNVISHTYGAWTTTASTLTANTTSSETGIITSGWQSSSNITMTSGASIGLNQGDTFTIAGVYPVNPQSRQRVGTVLQNFVVNASVTFNGAQVVNVSPALISAGQFQNISITGTGGATQAVTPTSIGTSATGTVSPQGIMMHKDAFTLAMVDLEVPRGVDFAGRASDKQAGLSIRVVQQYTINNDALPCRFDSLFGWAPLYQEFSCRIAN